MGLLSRRIGKRKAPALLRQAAVYTVSQLVSKAIPFLLLPVMTRYLTPADYGIVAMFLLVALLFEPLISLGLGGALTVKFYDRGIDLPAYVGTGISLVILVALPVAALLFIAREPISQITQVPPVWLLLAVPLVVARSIGSGMLALLRAKERALQYGVLVNLQSLGLIALSIMLVVGLGLTWRGRLIAELIGWLGFAFVALTWLWRSGWLRRSFVREYARDLVRFGGPLIPHTLGAVLMVQTDRFLLTNLVGVSETGLYTVGYQLALVIQLAALAFNNAYTPWLFRNLTEATDETRRRLVGFTYLQFGAMAALALAVAVVMPWLGGVLLGRDFAASGRFVGWFAIGFLFSAMYYMVTNYIFYAQKTRWLAAVTISVALLNIPLTFALIKLNGGVGAAQAMAISYGLSFVLTWFVSNRVYPMPWFERRRTEANA